MFHRFGPVETFALVPCPVELPEQLVNDVAAELLDLRTGVCTDVGFVGGVDVTVERTKFRIAHPGGAVMFASRFNVYGAARQVAAFLLTVATPEELLGSDEELVSA